MENVKRLLKGVHVSSQPQAQSLLTDLPLATPELYHDALREIISPCSTTVRDEGYSPLPTGAWQLVFSTPSKEVCTSTSSVTHRPRLSACSETLPMASYSQNELASKFSLNSKVKNLMLSSSLNHSLYSVILQIHIYPRITSFLSFLNKVAWF
jgi:hypothetical protein